MHSIDILVTNDSDNIPNTSDDTANHGHEIIRGVKANDLKSIAKRQKLHDDALKKQQQQHDLGDLVGIYIDRADGTNTTRGILPCKIVSVHSLPNENVMYKVCALKGVLSTPYDAQDLLDLRECDFADLRGVDPTTLSTITFTEACKEYVLVGINSVATACNCNGKCATKSCPCKAKNVKCCAQCHPKKKHGCANIRSLL